MDWRKYFTGEYLGAVEFGDKMPHQPTFTISGIKPVEVEEEGKPSKNKAVITFKDTDRAWLLNKTNAICLAGMFGNEANQWVGKRVTLLAVMVPVGKSREPGIRIKGSPDIAEHVDVEIKLPRKRPFTMRMLPTTEGAVGAQPSKSRPPPQSSRAGDEEQSPFLE
jgi:hypothetical protein